MEATTLLVVGGAVGAVVAPYAVPVVLSAAGFSGAGVVAGSAAAVWQVCEQPHAIVQVYRLHGYQN